MSIATAWRRRAGLTSFLRHLLQGGVVEGEIGHDVLQPGILLLELLQLLGVVGLHPAVLVPPAVEGLLRNLQVLGHCGDVGAIGLEALSLSEFPNDLLGGVPASLHDVHPPSIHLRGQEESHSALAPWAGVRSPSRAHTLLGCDRGGDRARSGRSDPREFSSVAGRTTIGEEQSLGRWFGTRQPLKAGRSVEGVGDAPVPADVSDLRCR